MNEEARQYARMFFRKWSTTRLTPAARLLLKEDVKNAHILFKAYGEDPSLFEGAQDAPSREWFGKRFHEL